MVTDITGNVKFVRRRLLLQGIPGSLLLGRAYATYVGSRLSLLFLSLKLLTRNVSPRIIISVHCDSLREENKLINYFLFPLPLYFLFSGFQRNISCFPSVNLTSARNIPPWAKQIPNFYRNKQG